MAGRPARLDSVEERVRVAVQLNLDYSLRVAARRALAPELGARAGVVVGLAAGERLLDGLSVGVRQHEHLARRRILGDDRHKTILVERHSLWRRGHPSITSFRSIHGASKSTSRPLITSALCLHEPDRD